MFSRFLPQSIPFFELLIEQNDLLQQMTAQLEAIMGKNGSAEMTVQNMSLLEDKADTLNHEITRHLSQTFITPIDREDIQAINMNQERVADGLRNLAGRFFVGGFQQMRFPAQEMVRNLRGMVKDTGVMLYCLSCKQELTEHLKALKDRKSECEMLLATGLCELQDADVTDFTMVKAFILWSQLYDRVEAMVEQVSDLADTLEQVAVKYV